MKYNKEHGLKITIPSFGLALGLFSLGNLLKNQSIYIEVICGIIGLILLIHSFSVFIRYPKFLKEQLKNPIAVGIMGTFPMGLMIFSTYINPLNYRFSFALWIFAIIIQLSLTSYFTLIILPKLHLKNIFSSILISYVGVTVISITSPTYHMENTLGLIFINMALICVIILYIVLIYRYIKIPVPNNLKPITSILAAPIIVVVGYLTVMANVNFYLVTALYLFTSGWYIYIIYKIIDYKSKYKWLPNHASYTFTLVINATASLLYYNYLLNININIPIIHYYFLIQLILAIFIVIYEVSVFIKFIFSENYANEDDILLKLVNEK